MELFTLEDDAKLVQEIQKEKSIFDVKCPEYKSVLSKEKLWAEIGRKLNKPVPACKRRWKNIKDCYSKHKKVMQRKTGSATPSIDYSKNPTWRLLSFLETVETDRNLLTNTDEDTNASSGSVDVAVNKIVDVTINGRVSQNETVDSSTKTGSPTSKKPTKLVQNETTPRRIPLKKRKLNYSDLILKSIQSISAERQKFMEDLAKSDKEDDVDNFLKSIGTTMKTLPPYVKASLKAKIFSLVSEAELEFLRPQSTTTTSSALAYPIEDSPSSMY